MTFDAPGLPEPNVEISMPLARAMRIALGNVPSMYDTMMSRTANTVRDLRTFAIGSRDPARTVVSTAGG